MGKRQATILFILIIAILGWLISFFWNEYLSETMMRHQVMQLPAMVLLGVLTGLYFKKLVVKDLAWQISLLIMVMTSFIFWMLPRSVDMAVIDPLYNRSMHLNMFVAGLVIVAVLRAAVFEIKIAFLGMVAAMTLAVGITLRVFNILLCSSFNIFQQQETGLYLIFLSIALFLLTYITFFRGAKDELKREGSEE
ncbi:MAG: hypothetical protein J5I50_09325 [Chitinophagaceae bacterium]|nr:hypothetical protein [Chitinophagaceae bacterium]